MRAAIVAEAGPIGAGGLVSPPGSHSFVLLNNSLELQQLSPLTCQVIFDAARRTNSYIFTAGRGRSGMMMSGSTGAAPDGLSPAVIVAGPVRLCGRLRVALDEWNRDTARERADGIVDADDQPVQPPPEPGDAPRAGRDPGGIVDRCEAMIRRETAALGWKVSRTLITNDPNWGVVWRADVATPDDPPYVTRETCWMRKGPSPGLSLSSQPLVMFDPRQSLRPLPAQ